MNTNMFCTLKEKSMFTPLEIVQGSVPPDLEGTLFRTGVGRFEDYGKPLPHWFDGPGFVAAIHFKGQKIFGKWKILDVNPEVEKKSDDFVLGRFGIAPKTMRRRVKAIADYNMYVNSANTALLRWQNRLFALYEGSIPTEVDPILLNKIHTTDLGIVKRAFSAHPKYLKSRATTYNFGFRILPRPSLDIYALPDQGEPSVLGSVPYNGSSFVHDFSVCDDYMVFISSPIFVNPWEMIVLGHPLSKTLKWNGKRKTEITVVPIQNPAAYFKIETDPFLFTHTANSYFDGSNIMMDIISYQDGTNLDWINTALLSNQHPSAPGHLNRITIDVATQTHDIDRITKQSMEVPTINSLYTGQRYRYCYAAGFEKVANQFQGFTDCLYLVDVNEKTATSISLGSHQVVNEPIFVPKDKAISERDGYLIALHYDKKTDVTFVSVVDVSQEPKIICKASLNQSMPFSFHGLWWPLDTLTASFV